MESEQPNNDHKGALFKVTPLSKYLAMGLFIVMPFVGGWIGYTFAPEKVVVETVVIERQPEARTADGRYVARVVEAGTKIEIFDFETNVVTKIVTAQADNATFWSSPCGDKTDLVWIDNQTLRYGVYDVNSFTSTSCTGDLLTHETTTIN